MTSSTLQTEDPRPSFPARLRTETYLARVDWHLEAVMNGKHRRSTIRELRQAILSDPRGIDVSLDDLGSPKSLARQYGDDEDLQPLWSIGVISAGSMLLAYWVLFLTFAFGMLAATDSSTPMKAHAEFLFVDVTTFSTAEAVGIEWTSGWAWLIVPAIIGVVSFLLGARCWRLFGRSERRTP